MFLNRNFKTYYRYLLPPLLKKKIDEKDKIKIFDECCAYLIFLMNNLKIQEINLVNETYQKSDKLFFDVLKKYFEYHKIDDQTLLIDLSLSLPQIKKDFRKSYKSIVNPEKLNNNFEINYLDDKNFNDLLWEQYQKLHYQTTKRITRSQKTWDIQSEIIKKGFGLLIYAKEKKTKKLISGSLYIFTKDELVYGSNASLPESRQYNLGHKKQFYAISIFKKKKIKYFFLTYDPNSKDFEGIQVGEKFMQILKFKSGFGKIKKPRKIFYCKKKIYELNK